MVREPERRELRIDERAPCRAVIRLGPGDEAGAPSGERVQVVEGAESRVVAHLAHRDATFRTLLDTPARVFVQRCHQGVLVRREVEVERGENRLDVLRRTDEAGRAQRLGRERPLELGIDLEEHRAPLAREVREARQRAKQAGAIARRDDRTARHVRDALTRERVLPEHERDGQWLADPQVLGSPALAFAHRGPHRRLQHVTPRRASGSVIPTARRVHQAAERARRRRAPSCHSG